ncbi:SDR family NAD(P)-dependent oxidoreductase [Amycolatopsis vastitatis]|uniref:Short-chain dehydrogenase/reductase n=1 Tax=Amycolatopsis vastitatis TaxID=1905142 RepID=A0A229SVW1_9PSEU|nr:SDR family NAD(P)-dependent oxidoreductase [Amycolatopsis vastitatis]OXM63205.1 short-chain dehydrogenase/reductase [Amycolatopsis vastitatis]
MTKSWFITGTSKGFGREWAEAALARGDRVAATARDTESLRPLVERYGDAVLPLRLDVTDRAAAVEAVRRAAAGFGSLDVLVNNAGYGHFGMVEELTEEEVRAELETNFFGTLWLTQAALPIMRRQGRGRIIQVTSEGGVRAFPGIGAYHASKWAVEGLSDSLRQEVAAFGIDVVCLEPGPYRTDFGGGSVRQSEPDPAYDAVREASRIEWDFGDPRATRAPMLELADTDDPPHRMFFGKSFAAVEAEYQNRLDGWRKWEPLALAAFG